MAGRSYVYNVARSLKLSSFGNGLDADGVKLFCGPMAKNVADRAMQVTEDCIYIVYDYNKKLTLYFNVVNSAVFSRAIIIYIYTYCRHRNEVIVSCNSDQLKALFAVITLIYSISLEIKVLGGNGYVGEYKVERLWRDSKLLEIGGGTNEAHHKNMLRDIQRYHTKIL